MARSQWWAWGLSAMLGASSLQSRPPDGGVHLPVEALDAGNETLDRRIVANVEANLATLAAQGALPPVPKALSGLQWPMGPRPGPGEEWYALVQFVDLDPAFPGELRDYTCGTRTYDTAAGYNHRGIDYSLWPFPWQAMDEGRVDVVAVASGILVDRNDGADDRSCTWDGPGDTNYAVVRHADGSIARYLHLKRGSVTTRPIGASIAVGEVLGKVGSSGISTGPHLHLELRASNHVNAAVIDPFEGACNTVPSAWSAQRPYREPRINRLSTHSTAPKIPVCPDTIDEPHLRDLFEPGEPITFVAAYRDPKRGLPTEFQVLRPNGTVFQRWRFAMGDDDPLAPEYYSGAYWRWSHTLPTDAAHGLWTFEATMEGRVSRHSFRVGAATVPGEAPLPTSLTGSWYEPRTSGQGFTLEAIDAHRFLLFFYGFDTAGAPLWLFGDYDPGRPTFAWGQAIDVPLWLTTGGRWVDFDADAVVRQPWGHARIRFDSCRRAEVTLVGQTGTQQLQLQKLVTPAGLDCPP